MAAMVGGRGTLGHRDRTPGGTDCIVSAATIALSSSGGTEWKCVL